MTGDETTALLSRWTCPEAEAEFQSILQLIEAVRAKHYNDVMSRSRGAPTQIQMAEAQGAYRSSVHALQMKALDLMNRHCMPGLLVTPASKQEEDNT
jgi:hypothetical protein